jgi:hypothetical protein
MMPMGINSASQKGDGRSVKADGDHAETDDEQQEDHGDRGYDGGARQRVVDVRLHCVRVQPGARTGDLDMKSMPSSAPQPMEPMSESTPPQKAASGWLFRSNRTSPMVAGRRRTASNKNSVWDT